MKLILFISCLCLTIYSCSPINKQHGYLLEDVISSADDMSQFNIGITSENDIFKSLGSPSIQIRDVNNVWIYLISVKRVNIFENDNITFQSIFRFEFDDNGVLLSKDFKGEKDFAEIVFSNDKTRVITDNYGITEQIYESFTRGQ